MHYRNMAIWISWNINIGRSLNSHDRFPRRKFKNQAPTSCSPGPILSPATISFELQAKMAEEIDLEKCNFCNFGSSVPWPHWCAYLVEVYPHTKLDGNRKNFSWTYVCMDVYSRTDTPEFQSTRSSVGDDLIKVMVQWSSFLKPSSTAIMETITF